MITLTILGKETNPLPEKVEEMLWGKYKEILFKEKELNRGIDHFEVFSILSGIDIKTIRESADHGLADVILWYYHNIYLQVGIVKEKRDLTKVVYDGKEYDVPQNLDWKKVGQFQDALNLANYIHAEVDNETLCQVLERIFLIYLYPVITGEEYKPEGLSKLNPDLARAIDVRGFGSFFFNNLIRSLLGTKKDVQIRDLLRKNHLQDSMKLQHSTNSTSLLKRLQKMILRK